MKWIVAATAIGMVFLAYRLDGLQNRVSELEHKVCIQGTVGCKPLEPGWFKQ